MTNLTEKLSEKFKRTGRLSPVEGRVERCDTLCEGGGQTYIVTIAPTNAPQEQKTFWIPDRSGEAGFFIPRVGDRIRGSAGEGVGAFKDFAGEQHRMLFDFRHLGAEAEEAAFAWFAARRREEEAARAKPARPNLRVV